MAHFWKQAEVDAVAASATLLEDNDHSGYEGDQLGLGIDAIRAARKRAAETSPFQPGRIVWADLRGHGEAPVRVLVMRLDLKRNEDTYEYIDHVLGAVERKKGGFGGMIRHVCRGDITRGYEKARKLGLHPAVPVDEVAVPA